MTTQLAYGKNPTDVEVEEGRLFIDTLLSVIRPGAYLVDSFPWLKYLPWYGRELKRQFESNQKLFTGQLNRVKEQVVRV